MLFIYIFYLFHNFIIFAGLLQNMLKWKYVQQLHYIQELITSFCRETTLHTFITLLQDMFGHTNADIIPPYITDFSLSSKSRTVV